MTDQIRPKIDAVAPALVGPDGRTLTSVYDALSDVAPALTGPDGRTLTSVYDALSDVAPALVGPDGRTLSSVYDVLNDALYVQQDVARVPGFVRLSSELEDQTERLDALQSALGAAPYGDLELASVRGMLNGLREGQESLAAALGAAPYGDLELASVRGMLNNVMQAQSGIIARLGASEISTELPGVRDLLSLILTSLNAFRTESATNAGLISGRISDVITNIGSGNSLLEDININIGSGNTVGIDIKSAIEANTQVTLDTSGSIRGEIVALVAQDATNHGESQAQLITIADQVGQNRALSEQILTSSDLSFSALSDISGFVSALPDAIADQTTAIGAMFDEHIGTAIDGIDNVPLNQWLDRIDDKLAVIAAEFGWGT